MRLALLAYNRGPVAVERSRKAGIDPSKVTLHTLMLGGGYGRRLGDDGTPVVLDHGHVVHASDAQSLRDHPEVLDGLLGVARKL